MSNELLKTVKDTIARHEMLRRGDVVVVALSGGPDSVCLLHLLEELGPKLSLRLCVAHFDHRLRGKASADDMGFARALAERKGLAFVTASADVRAFAKREKLSIEDAARRLRYDFLLRSAISMGASRVAVGHNADDQAETILMRLIRGSGPQGLAGIPPVRALGPSGGPRIIRPLIHAWRGDIMRYLRERKLQYREDESNKSPEYLRNRVRLELLPRLEEEYNPRIKQRLASAAAALAAENDFMETEAKLLAGELVTERRPEWLIFNADPLGALHPALRRRVLLALILLAKSDAPMIEATHYEEADAIMRAGRGRLDLPGGLRLELSEGAGLISDAVQKPASPKRDFDVSIDGATIIPDLGILIKIKVMPEVKSPAHLVRMCTPKRQYFDLDAVRTPLRVRVRRPGDSFRPLGTRGTKKLKDFFIDKKIPRFLRDRVPILTSAGKPIWIMGHAIDDRYKVGPGTSAALRVDYER